jgi:mono/diheme cytochrome c family protein
MKPHLASLFAALAGLQLGTTLAQAPLPATSPPTKRTPERTPEQAFRFLDFNADSRLSQAEFNQLKEVSPEFKKKPFLGWLAFRKFDADRDGSLSLGEFRSFFESVQKRKADKAGSPATPASTFSNPPVPQVPQIPQTPPSPEDLAFFTQSIQPLFETHCYECHSGKADSIKGQLRLDTRDGLRHGGESGPALIPGHPEQSLLLEAVRHSHKDLQMPPPKKGKKLSDSALAALEHWIQIGAPDPRPSEPQNAQNHSPQPQPKKGELNHWAFSPIQNLPPPPPSKNPWARTEVDRFILEKLEAQNLQPVQDAPPATLLRRLSFDLLGLPPDPQTLEAFTANPSPAAFEALVDQWLNHPAFGERWARHWLDVARYADSSGRTSNLLYPHAWRYRDYVIRSFQTDKPFHQFLLEQIAGDLLPAQDEAQRTDQLVATGFLALGPKQLSETDPLQFQLDVVDEQLDTLGQAMLGLSFGCARCHDHKYDPISQRDYSALAGIFRSTQTLHGTTPVITNNHPSELLPLPASAQRLSAPLAPSLLKSRIDTLEKQLRSLYGSSSPGSFTLPDSPEKLRESIQVRSQLAVTHQRLKETGPDGYALPLAMGVQDAPHPSDLPLYSRGDPSKPLALVPRGLPEQLPLSSLSPAIVEGSGRLELAHWIASPQNPLPARVFVNRVWQHLFGRGLVTNPDNFGLLSEPPSHPQLLDYLASRFLQNGGSLKSLIKSLVLSRTYQLDSTFHPANHAADPDNMLRWRMPPRRLEAEALRDAMLSVSGQLQTRPPIGSLAAKIGDSFAGIAASRAASENEAGHRSIYLSVLRDDTQPILALFDFADPNTVTGLRPETTTASQALFLMNHPFLQKVSRAWAIELSNSSTDPLQRLTLAYQQAFARRPQPPDRSAFTAFFKNFPKASEIEAWTAFCQALLCSDEFRTLR